MSTFLLIPGAGGRASYWHLVVPFLRNAGHTVVAPDLPAQDDDAGLGAFTAPVVAEQRRAVELVLVAPMIPRPHETPGAWWDATGQPDAAAAAARADGRDPDAPFDPAVIFLHDVQEEVLRAGAHESQEQSDRPFRDPFPLDAWPDVPTRVIAGRYDRFFPLEFGQRVARDRLGVEPEVVNSGHLPALACPQELRALLLTG